MNVSEHRWGHTLSNFFLKDYQSRVEFCIPILVNASIAYDVSERPTPEMVEQARLFVIVDFTDHPCCFINSFLLFVSGQGKPAGVSGAKSIAVYFQL